MARMYPDPLSPDTKSNAERILYEQLREQLDNSFVVIHSASWITHHPKAGAQDGEADFIIAHPDHGVLLIEVKGGEIILDGDRDVWFSEDLGGTRHEIKDPFKQAKQNGYALGDHLKLAPVTSRASYPVYYAVAFPDVGLSSDLRPDAPRDIIIDQARLHVLQETILNIFDYWRGERKAKDPPGPAGIEALTHLLAPSWHLKSRISYTYEDEHRQIKQLTERQFIVLHMLSRRCRRAAVIGGAGTGKTMLAVELACRMAAEGQSVLFVCYNRNLAEWLAQVVASDKRLRPAMVKKEQVVVTTFHGLCGKAINWSKIPYPSGPGDRYEKLEAALMDAIDATDKRFDAIIVDEGQDFEEDWWISLEALLQDEEESSFYVFFDDNQRLYDRIQHLPIKEEPFPLDLNCRNTQLVHSKLEPYSRAKYRTLCHTDAPRGRPVQVIAADEGHARQALKAVVLEYTEKKEVAPQQMVILTPRSADKSMWHEGDKLGTLQVTWNLDTKLKKAIRVSTIHSFKGLESPVVILTELEHAKSDEVLYVGMSRARNDVVVIGDLPEPRGATDQTEEEDK